MSKIRILIVEDEQIVVMDIKATLESSGYMVVGQADKGADAILKAGELRPDLVMMDIGLKGEIDGIEAATQIRAKFDLPVIFLTAFANQSTLERAREAEPFGYILKPFEENELTIAIEMAIYKHSIEYKLRESENKFRNVIEHASDGIVLNDNQGNIIEWNPAMEEITGLKRSDVLGQSAADITFRLWPKETKSEILEEENKKEWKDAVQSEYSNPDQMTVREIENLQGERRIIQSNGFAIDTKREKLSGVIIRDITENKRAEEAVTNSEKRFRALIENGRDNISLLAADGTLLWESPTTAFSLGYAPNQFVEHNIFELMHPDDKDWTGNMFMQVVQEPGSSREGIFRLLHGNGSWRWIEATTTNLLHEPNIQAIIINYRDVTDRKNAEEALSKSEAIYRQAIEVAGAVPYHQTYSDNNNGVIYDFIGEGIREITGYGPEEFNKALWDSLTEERILMEGLAECPFEDAVQQVRSGEFPIWKCEHRIKDRYGKNHWVFESAVELRDENGISHGSIGTFQDITESKLAEDALRESEERLRLSLQASNQGLYDLNVQTGMAIVNREYAQMLGYNPETFVETNAAWIERLHPDDRDSTAKAYSDYINGLMPEYRVEFRQKAKDGNWKWILSLGKVVKYDTEGKPLRMLGTHTDITERKFLEQVERDQRRLAEVLRDTSEALNSTLKLDEVLDRVLDNIERLVTYDAAIVLLIDGHAVRKIRQHNNVIQGSLNQPGIGNTIVNLINVPILNEMIETRRPCLIPDTQSDARWRAIPGMSWVRSFISAPVEIRGRVAGIINILSATPGFFTPTHSERLMAFAGQVAVAIENAQLFERAYYLSVTDSLTELPNRRHFFEIAKFEFERIQRFKRTLSVMMVDIDHFKIINDTHGHAVGDLALHEIATRIKNSVRTVDIVARYGGEEFIVLMPETGLDEACQVAERVRRSVADSPIEAEAFTVTTTLSIGVAEKNEKSKNMDQLIMYADQALYIAKANGRNRVAVYENV